MKSTLKSLIATACFSGLMAGTMAAQAQHRSVTPTERPIINCLACGRAKIPGNCRAHDSVGGQAWISSTKHKVGFELPI